MSDKIIDIRDALNKKKEDSSVEEEGATLVDLMIAALTQFRSSMEKDTDYIVNTILDGEAITWIAVNEANQDKSLRLTLSRADLQEWLDE